MVSYSLSLDVLDSDHYQNKCDRKSSLLLIFATVTSHLQVFLHDAGWQGRRSYREPWRLKDFERWVVSGETEGDGVWVGPRG